MSNWQKVKIGDFLKRIKRPIKLEKDKNYKLVTIKMHHNGIVLREEKQGSLIKSNMYEVHKGDFILSGIDARNGAFGIIPEALDKAIVTNDFWYFELDENIVNKYFFLELTATSWFDDICKKGSDGTTQRIRLQKDKFFNQEIVLPPLEEQIIFIKNFKQIKSTKEDLESETSTQQSLLKQLKQTILQEAIEGKLTAKYRVKNPDIGTAKELLEQIKIEKEKLVKDKKIKLAKPLAPINEDEIPFDIPPSWEWCRFQDITTVITCGIASTPTYYESGRIFLSAKNVKPFKFMPDEHKYINEDTYQKIIANAKPDLNDILLTRVGAGIGEAAVIDQEIDFAYYVSLTLIKPLHLYINSKFILNFLNSEQGIKNAISYTSGKDSSQGNLNVNNVRTFLIPIPPFEEQKEIVATIEKLFAICDELEAKINQNKTIVQTIMATVLKEAFEN